MTLEKITSNQENRIMDLYRDALRKAGLSKEEAQEIIENGNILQSENSQILKRLAIADKRFGPALKEFTLTVPTTYNHDTQIDEFGTKKKPLKTTYYYNEDLTSANFSQATNKLIPGKSYRVKIFPILETVSGEDCINFLKKQNAFLVGAQGLTLAQELHENEFPIGKWTVSFDKKETLWTDADGNHRVPSVHRHTAGAWLFPLGSFGNDWPAGHCLLCFCDLQTSDT